MKIKLKILVCIKQVPDTNAMVKIVDDKPVYDEKTTYIINRYDEYALEEALQLKDKGLTFCIHTISIGPQRVQKALRRSLEMGADDAFHIPTEDLQSCTPFDIAYNIVQFAKNNYDIIFMGIMSQDTMNTQTAQLVASLLKCNYATGVTELAVHDNFIQITRELDAQESIRYNLTLPCVISIQSSMHMPRYPSLSNVLRARKQTINVVEFQQSKASKLNCYYSTPNNVSNCIFIEGNLTNKVIELFSILHKNAIL